MSSVLVTHPHKEKNDKPDSGQILLMITARLPQRGVDEFGSGHFGAPRGNHRHNGIDYEASHGQEILAPASGVVSKIGYPYGDDLSFRYVEVTDGNGLRHRVFYILPKVEIGMYVVSNVTVIGTAQDLGGRYPCITNHVHYEIIKDGKYLNPNDVA